MRCSRLGAPILLSLVLGCAELESWRTDSAHRYQAYKAWKEAGPAPVDDGLESDYSHGWKQGYYEIAAGGNGQSPLLPPKKYWGVKYQSRVGRERVEAWYEGYQLGTIAADKDGLRGLTHIPVAPDYNLPPVVGMRPVDARGLDRESLPVPLPQGARLAPVSGTPHIAKSGDAAGRTSASPNLPAPQSVATQVIPAAPQAAAVSTEPTPAETFPAAPPSHVEDAQTAESSVAEPSRLAMSPLAGPIEPLAEPDRSADGLSAKEPSPAPGAAAQPRTLAVQDASGPKSVAAPKLIPLPAEVTAAEPSPSSPPTRERSATATPKAANQSQLAGSGDRPSAAPDKPVAAVSAKPPTTETARATAKPRTKITSSTSQSAAQTARKVPNAKGSVVQSKTSKGPPPLAVRNPRQTTHKSPTQVLESARKLLPVEAPTTQAADDLKKAPEVAGRSPLHAARPAAPQTTSLRLSNRAPETLNPSRSERIGETAHDAEDVPRIQLRVASRPDDSETILRQAPAGQNTDSIVR